MTKRLLQTLALSAASAFALAVATPAYACGKDCECSKGSGPSTKGTKPVKPAEKPAAGEKKAGTSLGDADRLLAADKCQCEKGGKGCTCKKGECTCANCAKAHDMGRVVGQRS
jgi:hypothetical protein